MLLFYLLVVNFDQFQVYGVHAHSYVLLYSSIALSAIAYNIQYTAQECIMMSYSVKMMSSCTLNMYSIPLYSCKTVFQTVTMVTGHTPRYPPTEHPVLAFKGAPARFPVIREHRSLHQYLKWSKNMNQQAEEYINTRLHGEPYISVHLRMGSDWVRGYNTAADREFITYVEDTSQVLCFEQSVITPMHASNLCLQLGSKFVST